MLPHAVGDRGAAEIVYEGGPAKQGGLTGIEVQVLGGAGSQLGVVLAAVVLVTLPELGREFAQYRMLLFGAAMVAIMVWRPRGLLSRRDPSLTLLRAKSAA